jgi:Uma2 family endonuclease
MMCRSACLILNAKWNALSREELEGIPRCAPDFVIELTSRWKTPEFLFRKMSLWIENGVSLTWLIDSGARSVTVYRTKVDPVAVNAN